MRYQRELVWVGKSGPMVPRLDLTDRLAHTALTETGFREVLGGDTCSCVESSESRQRLSLGSEIVPYDPSCFDRSHLSLAFSDEPAIRPCEGMRVSDCKVPKCCL